jgi:protein-S-isoprenylcysteine O-methyltransferase Ste14
METAMTERGARWSRRTIGLIATGLFVLVAVPFGLGVYQGYTDGGTRAAPSWAVPVGIALLVAITALGVWASLRARPLPPATGPGEIAEAGSRRQFWLFVAAMFGIGVAVGMTGAAFEIDPGGFLTGLLPPGIALAMAAVATLALAVGTVIFLRRSDEVERGDNIWASAVAANALLIVYPAWFFLWKGGWVTEPSHVALFLIVYVTMMLAYLYRKFR